MSYKIKNRFVYLFVLILCVASVSVYTLYYVHDKSESVSNNFIAASYINIDVEETFTGTVKSNIGIENTGTKDSYVRMEIILQVVDVQGRVVANPIFYDIDGNEIEKAVQKEDLLTMKYNGSKTYNEEDWILVNEVYYYKYPLEVGDVTSYVYDKIKQKETYYLYNNVLLKDIYSIKVTVLAQAIELEGVSVWEDVIVLDDKTLSSVGGN